MSTIAATPFLLALVAEMPERIPVARIDRIWVFPPRALGEVESGLLVFVIFAVPKSETGHRCNFLRISIWMSVSGVFWIVGGLADPEMRLWLWLIALAIGLGPIVGREAGLLQGL